MRMNIYRQLVFIINDRRTWAKAIESNLFQRHMIFHQRQWTAYVGRTLVIEALYEHEQYAKGRIWHIPEHELDRALAILRKKDPHIKNRLNRGAHYLLPRDVESIIELATYGYLKLNLKTYVNTNPFY